MRDPAEVYTKRGTPLVLIGSRIALISFFVIAIYGSFSGWVPQGSVTIWWFAYLIGIYIASEGIYGVFKKRDIDLAFAFPLLFAVVLLNFFSILIEAQERYPIINRAEHFASFVLFAYIVWVFFLKYLPQKVWKEHPYYTSLLVLSVTSLAGVMNEIVELALDLLVGTNTIGPRFDTAMDLLMNTLGAGLFLAVQLIVNEGNVFSKE